MLLPIITKFSPSLLFESEFRADFLEHDALAIQILRSSLFDGIVICLILRSSSFTLVLVFFQF